MKKFSLIVIGLLGLAAFVFGQTPDTWYYIRTIDKSAGQFEATTSPQAIVGKNLVSIVCEKCAYYHEFANRVTGNITRVASTQTFYDRLRYQAGEPLPTRASNNWRVSYETVTFNTPDGDLGLNDYAIKPISNFAGLRRAYAAIAFDANSNSAATLTAVSSFTWSHPNTSKVNNNLLMTFGVMDKDPTDANRIVSNITYNGTSATFQRRDVGTSVDPTLSLNTEMWYLPNPARGTNTVSVTLAGTVVGAYGGADSFTNVKQTSPIDGDFGLATTNTVAPAIDVTTNIDNVWLVETVNLNSIVLHCAPNNGQTEQYDTFYGKVLGKSAAGCGYTNGPITPAGVIPESWTCTGGSCVSADWVITGLALIPEDPVGRFNWISGIINFQSGIINFP